MIVITMAGQSRRFQEAGIHIPKWSIHIGNNSVLSLAIESLEYLRAANEKIILVLLDEQKEFLERSLDSSKLKDIIFVYLKNKTLGQAETLAHGLGKIDLDFSEKLTVWCADAFITPESFLNYKGSDNRIYVSQLPGEHWSFAKIKNGKIVETAEKKRISEFASIGLYEFDSIKTFLSLNLQKQLNLPEIYIAPLYNQLIERGKSVTYFEVSSESYYSFGTPQELLESAQRLNCQVDLSSFNSHFK